MHKHLFKFTQSEPESIWVIDNLPTGADGAVHVVIRK